MKDKVLKVLKVLMVLMVRKVLGVLKVLALRMVRTVVRLDEMLWVRAMLAALVMSLASSGAALAAPPDSERLDRAKDFIADERWTRAIAELRGAVADRKEPARDEAAFWLAHSLYQAGDPAEALTVVDLLERDYPRSRWVKPARSLRIEIAHRLQRKDLLWKMASPKAVAPPSPPAAAPVVTEPAEVPRSPKGAPRARTRVAAPATVVTLPEVVIGGDADLRIQALMSLMSSEAARVVPILREIALKAEDEAQARRAIYALAQSNRADARSTIVEVARTGDEPRQVTAVKVLAYQGWPEAEKVLLDVYVAATPHVKRQVIRAFGNVGSRMQLRRLFETSQDVELKHAIINALFEAGARSELERIAKNERDPDIRRAARSKLDLMKPVK